jgi:hypothetical protein
MLACFVYAMILIQQFAGRLASGSQDSNQPIILKAEYTEKFSWLTWSFPFFYGYIHENLDQFMARMDFQYDKSILISEDLNQKGVSCSPDFECSFLEKETFIVENSNHKLISTHQAGVPLYFNPFLGALKPYALPKFQFYLNLNDNNYKDINTVGIAPGSGIWPYLSMTYRTDRVFVLFQTNFKENTYKGLLNNMMGIETTVTLFPNLDNKLLYQSNDIDTISAKGTMIELLGLGLAFEAQFSYEDPFIFRSCSSVYNQILTQVSRIICKDFKNCEKSTDIRPDYDNKQKLAITFSNNSKSGQLKDMRIEFEMAELVAIGQDDKIYFNFGAFKHIEERQNSIYLGLLFLRKVNLYFEYHDTTNTFSIYLSLRESRHSNLIFTFFLLASLLFSGFATLFLVRANKFPKPIGTMSDADNSNSEDF